jgi:hypothetical protein
MRKRQLRWVLGVAALTLVLAVGTAVMWPRPGISSRITSENFDLIKASMPRVDVEAVLGPPGDYRTGPTLAGTSGGKQVANLGANWPPTSYADSGHLTLIVGNDVVWEDDAAHVVVWFDDKGTVECGEYVSTYRQQQGPLDNLLWRAKRQWRRWFP